MDSSPAAPSPSATFDNASVWHNFTLWTSQHLGLAVNMTRYAPSFEDLVWAGPRMVMKLGKLGSFISFPDAIDGFGQTVIPDATGSDIHTATSAAAVSGTFVQSTGPSATPSLVADQDPAALVSRFSMEGAKGLGSVFSYATSKWALCCIAMAVVLNRTHIFAATRRRLPLRWPARLLLRITPIILFTVQIRSILQSIQCQTSPDFAELRWGNTSKSSDLMFSQRSTILHGLTSYMLFGASDEQSCLAVRMVPPDDQEAPDLKGSLSLLWPLFTTFCLSQFLETVSCAVQGRPVPNETGMSLFEHSLAFAEADAAISNQLGWGLFSSSTATVSAKANLGANIAISRSMIMKRVNTPPEVLVVACLSSMSHLTSHVLGVLGKQANLRLVNTGFWALCFMGAILWSAVTFSLDDPARQGLLRYPTVCIIGFIPHVLILMGIVLCVFIYAVALVVSAMAVPATTADGRRLTLKERVAYAQSNMQANVSFSDIRISVDMDFYTALLRTGFGAITMASEAVYLNEDKKINLRTCTWLEEERYRELEELRTQWIGGGIPGSRYDAAGVIGLVPVQNSHLRAANGYSRERAAQKVTKSRTGDRAVRVGVGAAERTGRWLMALEYMIHITKLVFTAWALAVCKVLSKLGVQNPPMWLRRLSLRTKAGRAEEGRPADQRPYELLASDKGSIQIARNDLIDVETELRQRLQTSGRASRPTDAPGEQEINDRLYSWWLKGGWWGNTDRSGDYMPADEGSDFDATSIISATESEASFGREDEADWESDIGEDDGQRTPTQRSPYATRESSPIMDTPMQMSDLASLLDPRSPEERDQARALAAHLSSKDIMTRSGFRRFEQAQRTHVLFPSHQIPSVTKMTPDEEEELLEQILLSRRVTAAPAKFAAEGGRAAVGSSWSTGAAGMGPEGPQCVVCQSAPRTIIVWPCRCLSLCDDCRVSLAMNNFDKCVCCRREVISFSRMYVP